MQATLTAGVFVQDDLLDLQGDIDSFSKDLREFAESAEVSSEMVLGIIGRIRKKGELTAPRNQVLKEAVGNSFGRDPPSPFATANSEDLFHVLIARRRIWY